MTVTGAVMNSSFILYIYIALVTNDVQTLSVIVVILYFFLFSSVTQDVRVT
jgi:hypothetical protein